MMQGIVGAFLVRIPFAFLMIREGWNEWLIFAILAAVLLGLCALTRMRLQRATEKDYSKQ